MFLSVTSRREILTSRRQNVTPLPRRDVTHHVATSNFDASDYSSVTSRREIITSRSQKVTSLSRRDVGFHVATSFGHPLCHVATWSLTSRRHMVMLSATSRRGLSRRDVGKSALCHVATWPRTSRRETGFKPGMGHFLSFTRANLSPEALASLLAGDQGPPELVFSPVVDLHSAQTHCKSPIVASFGS